VVTLPGDYMRGRQSAAMLRLMGADALVARSRDEYLALVERLAQDGSWRESLRQRLRNAQGELFGRTDALQHVFAFFEREAAKPV